VRIVQSRGPEIGTVVNEKGQEEENQTGGRGSSSEPEASEAGVNTKGFATGGRVVPGLRGQPWMFQDVKEKAEEGRRKQ